MDFELESDSVERKTSLCTSEMMEKATSDTIGDTVSQAEIPNLDQVYTVDPTFCQVCKGTEARHAGRRYCYTDANENMKPGAG